MTGCTTSDTNATSNAWPNVARYDLADPCWPHNLAVGTHLVSTCCLQSFHKAQQGRIELDDAAELSGLINVPVDPSTLFDQVRRVIAEQTEGQLVPLRLSTL